MSLTRQLRLKYDGLWQKMVFHPFVEEMGDGTLPASKFRAYFLQDYVFVNDLATLISLGIAKAPTIEAAGVLHGFLSGLVAPEGAQENDLFVRAFRELGASEAEYSSAAASPTTQAFGDFLVRTGYEGDFDDIATILYVTEGAYLDWGTRLLERSARPANPIYREWIELHGPEVLGRLVEWLGRHIDREGAEQRSARTERIFLTALRYEYLFWEAAYHGESWPGNGR